MPPQEDTAAAGGRTADQYGRDRLSNVADTQAGRELDPSRILGPQRHGEWFQQLSPQGERVTRCGVLLRSRVGRGGQGGVRGLWCRACGGQEGGFQHACFPTRLLRTVPAVPLACFCRCRARPRPRLGSHLAAARHGRRRNGPQAACYHAPAAEQVKQNTADLPTKRQRPPNQAFVETCRKHQSQQPE